MAKRDLLTEFKAYYDSQHPDAQALIRRFILTEVASPKSQPPARPARAQSSSKKKGLPSAPSTETVTVTVPAAHGASGGD